MSVGDLGDVAATLVLCPVVAAPTLVGVEMRSHTLSRGCLELVEAIEEGAKSAEIATIERDAEAGERGEFGFIGFLGVGSTGGDEGLGAEDIVEIFVETDESASGDLSVDADEHDVSDIAIGVEVVVEVDHFTAGEFEVVGNFEEGEVLLGYETISE